MNIVASLNTTLVTTTTANSKKTEPFLYLKKNDPLNFTLVAIYALFGVLGAVGNLLVILVVWKNKPMRNPTNLLLSSVALSDFMFVVLNTPCSIVSATENFTIQELSFLKLATYAFFSANSSITLTLLANQRYNALVNPMKIQRRLSKRCAKIAICVIWLAALILTCPALAAMGVSGGASRPALGYVIYILTWYFLTFIVPMIVTAFCYGKIVIGVYVTKNICSQTTGQPRDISNRKKLTNLLLIITLVFMAARIPMIVVQMCVDCATIRTNVHAVAQCVYDLSPCLNPIVYVAYNTNYREGAKKLLRSCFCKNRSNLNLSS